MHLHLWLVLVFWEMPSTVIAIFRWNRPEHRDLDTEQNTNHKHRDGCGMGGRIFITALSLILEAYLHLVVRIAANYDTKYQHN